MDIPHSHTAAAATCQCCFSHSHLVISNDRGSPSFLHRHLPASAAAAGPSLLYCPSRHHRHHHLLQHFVSAAGTVEPPNNGHSEDRSLVHCREVVPISEVTECIYATISWGQTVFHSAEVVCFLECPLSEVPLYICTVPGAYEPPKAARSVQLRIIAQNGVCIYSST